MSPTLTTTTAFIHNATAHHPLLLFSALLALLALLSLLLLLALFKPAGLRPCRNNLPPILPPGPPGLPILGNLLTLKTALADPSRRYLKHLATAYGELTTVHLGAKTFIFLNTQRVVHEFIAKRGSATNDRSPMPVAFGIMSHGGRRSVLMRQDPWQEPRRAMHSLLNGSALNQYGEWQELESSQMLAEYLLQPTKWYRHHLRYANSVIHRIALGERLAVSTVDLEALMDCVKVFNQSIGASIVDWFPALADLPRWLQPWRAHWERLDRWNYNVYRSWWVPAREKVMNGTAPPSFVRDTLLHSDTRFTGDDDDAMYVAMQLIEAGSGTTTESLNIMVMAALERPEAFVRARQEVDRVCGAGSEARLPVLGDMESLGYICAMAKELLRWRPIFAVFPDHVSLKDIEFEGYRFPAGTSFVINQTVVGDECEDPERFMPERWLGDGREADITHGMWQFGGGRRVCVGYRLAQRSLFINIARLVQCFDFEANGPYDSKSMNHDAKGEPFPVKVTVRDEQYAKLIMTDAEHNGVMEDAKLARDKL